MTRYDNIAVDDVSVLLERLAEAAINKCASDMTAAGFVPPSDFRMKQFYEFARWRDDAVAQLRDCSARVRRYASIEFAAGQTEIGNKLLTLEGDISTLVLALDGPPAADADDPLRLGPPH